MTVEDPIEYELAGVGQTQVNAKIDLTFAKALRAILRQDPDVIMIGEIRDFETAQIAIQASLTGHLVLATLHTNDAASAVTRLIDMGVEPFLLSSSLLGVLAQRLVRKLCTATLPRHAAAPTAATPATRAAPASSSCWSTDDAIRAQIHNRAAEADIREAALKRRHDADARRRRAAGADRHHLARRAGARDPRLTSAAMPAYSFEALDAQGQTRKGVMEADTARSARGLLRAQSLVPLSVEPLGSWRSGRRGPHGAGHHAVHAARLQCHRAGDLDAPARRAWCRPACRWSAR